MISTALSSDRPHTVILHGFDRSGSSAISRTLATHPEIELFMQPFNSGPVRQKMYRIWKDGTATSEDIRFFKGLEDGELFTDYIQSHWFTSHSTSQSFVKGHLHVVKTTINHFLFEWCAKNFPRIHQWAIWRDPNHILRSLMKNDFVHQWYSDAFDEILEHCREDELLAAYFRMEIEEKDTAELAAWLIAVRTHVLFHHVGPHEVIFYEDFLQDASAALEPFVRRYDYDMLLDTSTDDLNITGQAFDPSAKDEAPIDFYEDGRLSRIFAPLLSMMSRKFPERRFS